MKIWKLSLLVAALLSTNAFALEPMGLSLGGGFNFAPAVELSTENNDNIYSEASNETSSIINRLRPSLGLTGNFGKTTFRSFYVAELGSYSSGGDDDYLDQLMAVDASFELSARHQFDIDAEYLSAHDARGSVAGVESVDAAEPDEYIQTTAGLIYFFGSDGAFANVDAYAETLQKRYGNNKLTTSSREYNKTTYGALLSLKASSAAEALFEARQAEITYEDGALGNDSSEQHLLLGLRWDMTGATTGEVKVGRITRSFDVSNKRSNTNLSWEGNLTWQPLMYSTVVVTTGQFTEESNGTGNYIAASTTSVSWNHEFSSFISTDISANYGEDEYVKASRDDINSGIGINATYSPLTWVDVGLSASKSLRNSNVDGLDQETNLVSLGLTLAL
jgi:hypothetical protein